MAATSTNGHHDAVQSRTGPLARTLLDMFSPVQSQAAPPVEVEAFDRRALWAADALHRANNLAQMSMSLGSGSAHRRAGRHADNQVAQARALARAYAELAAPGTTGCAVPCAPLLGAIATRLVELFGDARPIRLHISTDHVMLPVEQRRALLLIASELVINALKYAFPADASGTISITLSRWTDRIELSVADDGRGISPGGAPSGAGTALMQKLAALLAADMRRFSTDDGLRVVVSMPCAAT